jgi:hypothetical protein
VIPPGITAQTSCRDYLQVSTEEREQAVKRIGVAGAQNY